MWIVVTVAMPATLLRMLTARSTYNTCIVCDATLGVTLTTREVTTKVLMTEMGCSKVQHANLLP
jgi:hypothetical protein